ncbi:DUF2182 domain-containing protein [Croceicoccus bisphenolivorans]|uniref:DUF2182 domain-containing protein n=1 Tax=Croceicoccus bisphenolivorans TaxID=1783232 RepID=UPI00082EC145|nr:DUF2182 domain-containing protein [Croceicoccus bisphenolivorans]
MALAQVALRHHRTVTIAALGLLTLLAWGWIISGAGMDASMDAMAPAERMPGMATPDMTAGSTGTAGWFALAFSMWWVMMVAMMLPAAAPTILLYARAAGADASGTRPATAAFLAGYLIAWGAFSLLATALQMVAENAGQIGHMTMTSQNRYLSSAVLIGAGLYQLSPWKEACLKHCRSPAHFLSRHFRPGSLGALTMGLRHGAYCVGCCWLLMALLFVGGVMNLAWIAILTLFVAAEKLLPWGRQIALLAGAGFVIWGAVVALT